jgi:hypothetical protein
LSSTLYSTELRKLLYFKKSPIPTPLNVIALYVAAEPLKVLSF